MKKAVLRSSHETVAEIDVNELDWIYGKTDGVDLIKVVDTGGRVLWCDEIEFIKED